MSGQGRPDAQAVDAAGLTLGIVATTWHAEITDALLDRALAAARARTAPEVVAAALRAVYAGA